MKQLSTWAANQWKSRVGWVVRGLGWDRGLLFLTKIFPSAMRTDMIAKLLWRYSSANIYMQGRPTGVDRAARGWPWNKLYGNKSLQR